MVEKSTFSFVKKLFQVSFEVQVWIYKSYACAWKVHKLILNRSLNWNRIKINRSNTKKDFDATKEMLIPSTFLCLKGVALTSMAPAALLE